MADLAASIRAKLLNVSKAEKVEFQELINRFGAEQFLERLTKSHYAERFIFKGGSLLAYIIETDRKTRDLDFSIKHVSNDLDDALKLVSEITQIALEDAIIWSSPTGETLNHPEMEYPGLRIRCDFTLGGALGQLQMDLAIGDLVTPRKIPLERIRYKETPLMGPDFEVLAYPPETIFSEKFQTCISKKGQNTRMKDYYDLLKLCGSEVIQDDLLLENIRDTFEQRKTELPTEIAFESEDLNRLQSYWSAFLKKMKIKDAPENIHEVIKIVNQKLKAIKLTIQ